MIHKGRGTNYKFAPCLRGEFNNSVQGLRLNPGTYSVRIGEGREESVKIEAEKIAICGSKK